MARCIIPGLALVAVTALSLVVPDAAAVDDLSIKMWYPDQVKPGESAGVSLEIRNENYDYLVNITRTGIHIEWMSPGDFAYNTTGFLLMSGQSRIVNITFQAPKDAKAKTYSNYEVIYYTIQNGTGGEWNNATWESTITEDFKVVTPSAQSQDWYSWLTSNFTCLCVGLIAVIIIVAVAMAARRGALRMRRRAYSDGSLTLKPSASPPSGYSAPYFPPPPYEETEPTAPEKSAKEPEPEPLTPAAISEPPSIPSPPPAPEPTQAPRTPPVIPAPGPDRGVDLMKPTDWDAIGKPGPAYSPGPATSPAASPDMGPKFCTYCGIPEPGPVCRNCGRRLV